LQNQQSRQGCFENANKAGTTRNDFPGVYEFQVNRLSRGMMRN
jgi:hypothetical protein